MQRQTLHSFVNKCVAQNQPLTTLKKVAKFAAKDLRRSSFDGNFSDLGPKQ